MAKKFDKHRKRLLADETPSISKRWQDRTSIALIYPNTYHVGMSNLGFQTVYRLLNDLDDIVCERSFLPDPDFFDTDDIISIESGKSIRRFDILAFSFSFENDYPNLLTILKKSNIPFNTHDRDRRFPLIIAGGVACSLNPEPIAAFIDCFFIGEVEATLPSFLKQHRESENRKTLLLSATRAIDGIYVPEFYQARYYSTGAFNALHPIENVPKRIKRIYLNDMSQAATCSAILTPNTTFDQTYLIEVSRGCPHGCRFCSTGFVYRPPRYRAPQMLQSCIDEGRTITSKIGLVGAAVSDLPGIGGLCSYALETDTALSFSSLRADSLDADFISYLSKSDIKTATIAPDAGSERMRQCINKGLTEDDILLATETLVANGIPNLKLYFMIGLPTETMADVEAIVKLCKKIKHIFLKSSRARKRIGDITVSVNSFVPKPHTPFQWAAMEEAKTLKQKIKYIRQGLKATPNVRVHSDVPRWAYVQALLSRGDRRVADLLLAAHSNDGNWPKTFKASVINADFYVHRERPFDEAFPWDFIDHGIKKSYLKAEFKKALRGDSTDPCDVTSCKTCGVC